MGREHLLLFRLLHMAPPQHRLDAGQQFHDAEWLGDIIVCTVFQSGDLVDLRGLRRKHDDRNFRRCRIGFQSFQNRDAVLVRQHDVQQDQCRLFFLYTLEKAFSVREALRSIAAGLESTGDEFPNAGVVFHTKYVCQITFPLFPGIRRKALFSVSFIQQFPCFPESQHALPPRRPRWRVSCRLQRVPCPVPLPVVPDSTASAKWWHSGRAVRRRP